MKSRDLNIELLIISTDNNWKRSGLELKDILIQQEFNFIGKGSNYYTGKEKDIYSKGLNCEHSGQLLTLYINKYNQAQTTIILKML